MTARRSYVDKPTKAVRALLRKFGEKLHDIDESVWVRPEKPPVVITLPNVRLVAISDEQVGLKPSEGAQLKAEDQIRIAAAARLRAELLAELKRLEQMPLSRWMQGP